MIASEQDEVDIASEIVEILNHLLVTCKYDIPHTGISSWCPKNEVSGEIVFVFNFDL